MKATLQALAIIFAVASCPGLSRSAAAQNLQRCSVDPVKVPARPGRIEGTVIGVISPQQVKVITERVEKETGARISPDYADLRRVVAKFATSKGTFETIAAVMSGPIPKPGDPVDMLSRYRDPRFPCDFIPVTVSTPAAIS